GAAVAEREGRGGVPPGLRRRLGSGSIAGCVLPFLRSRANSPVARLPHAGPVVHRGEPRTNHGSLLRREGRDEKIEAQVWPRTSADGRRRPWIPPKSVTPAARVSIRRSRSGAPADEEQQEIARNNGRAG